LIRASCATQNANATFGAGILGHHKIADCISHHHDLIDPTSLAGRDAFEYGHVGFYRPYIITASDV
jgi:hypothetical protein